MFKVNFERISRLVLVFLLLTLNRQMPTVNRLRVDVIHVNEYKLRHNFANTLNLLCSCFLETESTAHFFLRCQIVPISV